MPDVCRFFCGTKEGARSYCTNYAMLASEERKRACFAFHLKSATEDAAPTFGAFYHEDLILAPFKLKVSPACKHKTSAVSELEMNVCWSALGWGGGPWPHQRGSIRKRLAVVVSCNLQIPEQCLKAVWGWMEVMTWHSDMTYSWGTIVSACTYCIFMTVRSVLRWREWLMVATVVALTPLGLGGSRVALWLMSSLQDLFCQRFSQTAKQVLGLPALAAHSNMDTGELIFNRCDEASHACCFTQKVLQMHDECFQLTSHTNNMASTASAWLWSFFEGEF